MNRLVYREIFGDTRDAIARETQINGLPRAENVAPIQAQNPRWQDLGNDWFQDRDASLRSA